MMIRGHQALKCLTIFVSTVLIVSLWGTLAFSDTMAPQINMNAVIEAPEPGVIKAQVFDDTKISRVTLYYRKPGETQFNSIVMKLKEDDVYYRELKRELGLEGSVEYYLVAQDTSGNETTLPAMNPQENPLKTSMNGSINMSADEIALSSPEPGMVYDSGDQLVMVTFFKTGRDIDFNTVRLFIDKVDRTREANLVGNILMWEPRRPFGDGIHELEITAKDVAGDPIGPNIWSFQVKTKMALPLGAEGDFFMGIQRDDRSRRAENVPLWNNKIDLGLKGQTGWLNWRAGVMLSSEETSFMTSEKLPDRQPINRYYLEGSTRHWKVRIGDSNPMLSELTLNGILNRGVNLEFKSNRFNTNFVWGYNKREIDEQIQIIGTDYIRIDANTFYNPDGDTLSTSPDNIIAIEDPNNPGSYNMYEFRQGTPKRDIIALKMSVTPVRNKYADWSFGFNFFGAEDDSTSLNYRYDSDSQTRYYAYRDSSFYTDYTPEKNWVGTIESTLRFNNNKSFLSAEFGGTIATENMFSYLTPEMKKQLPTTISEDTFPLNGSTQTSFDKLTLKDNVGKGLADAVKSVYSFKFDTVVPIPMTKTNFRAEAYRIPTHYVSLGNPQQKTDIGGIKFTIKSRILKDQVGLNFGYNSYSDNLDNERMQYRNDALSLTDLTKDTNITNFSINVSPKRWIDYSPTVTLGFRNYNAKNNLDLKISANDTTNMVDTSTNTFMFGVGGTLPFGVQRHSGMLSITNMGITDNRPLKDYDLNESDNLTVMFNLNSQINPMPLNVTASIGHTGNKSYMKQGSAIEGYSRKEVDTGILLFNLSGTYKWLRDRRLKTTAGFGYIGASNGESGMYEIDNNKVTFKIEADYQVTSVSSVGVLLRYGKFTDNVDSGNDYNEPVFGINLRSAF